MRRSGIAWGLGMLVVVGLLGGVMLFDLSQITRG